MKAKLALGTLALASLGLLASGCGPGDSATSKEESTFKHPDLNAAKNGGPPPGAMKPPADFKSSLGGGAGGGGGAAPKPPTNAGPGG